MNLSFHDLKSRAEGFQMRTYLRAKLQIGSTAPNFFFQNCHKISRACIGLHGRAVSVLLLLCHRQFSTTKCLVLSAVIGFICERVSLCFAITER